jgi:exocyst complex component 4
MSRVSPYAATPRGARPIADYGGPQSTRPLEIGRSIRPSTPTNSAFSNGPSRPNRSGLRTRQTSISSIDSRLTRDSRLDSTSETRQTPPRSRPRPPAMPISTSPEEMSPLSTASPSSSATVNAALSALQSAGQRRRAMTAGSQDAEWERQRSLEQEAERQLQQRIKDRVPQRRAKGKAKAGDIDGMRIPLVVTCGVVFIVRLCPSGAGSNPGRLGIMYIARCKTYHPR